MYREEKWVRGQLFWRSTPNGDWHMATPEQVISKLREILGEARYWIQKSGAPDSGYMVEKIAAAEATL